MSRQIKRLSWVGLVAACLAVAGCDKADMYTQEKSDTWDKSAFLPKQSTMQAPVPGTIPRDQPNQPVAQPATITQSLLDRGHERFDIFCTPCHGLSGKGNGMIVQRGFPRPPTLYSDRLMAAKAQYFYDVITVGHGTMYSYADRVPPPDRWAIAAYIRALQTSQHPGLASLPQEDRAHLKDLAP